jgi:DNA-binding GntR family transcriptional regulator
MSRGPIREAVSQLVSEGLVVLQPGLGAFVKSPERRDLVEVFQFREWVEASAAEEAARSEISPKLCESIQGAVDESKLIAQELRRSHHDHFTVEMNHRWFVAEMSFHMNIINISGNRRVSKIMSDQHLLSQMLWKNAERRTVEVAERVYDQHAKIWEAIQRRDAQAAYNAMRTHVRDALEGTLADFDRQQTEWSDTVALNEWQEAMIGAVTQVEQNLDSLDSSHAD